MIIKNKLLRRFTSLLVSMTLVVSLLSGCSLKKADNALSEQDIDKIVETVSDEIISNLYEKTKEDADSILEDTTEALLLSSNWEDYVGDIETFIYGLLIEKLGYKYDVFPAYTITSDGTEIYGIAYSDYSQGYLNEDDSKCFFSAGMLFYGEEPILSDEEFDNGLEVINLDYRDEETSFLLEYISTPFTEHCVVYDKYVLYGVDENGQIYYDAKDYARDEVDESLGSLYSYDEAKSLINLDFGEYVYISGESLYAELDYKALEEEVNNIINSQNENFTLSQIETYAYQSQESIANYLLSLQEETFMGYDVDDLVAASRELDPMECYRLTEDGVMVVEVQEVLDADADTLAKWLVGVGCAVTVIVGLVGSTASLACPALSACCGAITGTAIEIFMQVMIEGKTFGSISWNEVIIATATGAIAGLVGPYVSTIAKGNSRFLVDTAIDGILGGVEQATIGWLNGASGQELIKSTGYGVSLGIFFSAGFKYAGKVLDNTIKKITPVLSKMEKKILLNLSSRVSKKGNVVLKPLQKTKDKLLSKQSEYFANRITKKQLTRLSEEGNEELFQNSFESLKVNNIVDLDGNSITKSSLIDLFKKSKNGQVVARYKMDEDMVDIVKQNGILGIYYDKNKYQSVILENGIGSNRDNNLKAASEMLLKKWKKNPSLVPESIKEMLGDSGLNISKSDLKRIIEKSDWVLHENIDLKTVTLVPKTLHNKSGELGIGHMGGVALAKHLKSHMGTEYFDKFVYALSSNAPVVGYE